MPRQANTKVNFNHLPRLMKTLHQNTEGQLNKMAEDAARDCKRDLESRNWSHLTNPMTKRRFKTIWQTGATENSVYFFYCNKEGNYSSVRDIFRNLAGDDYGGRDLDEITLAEHVPSQGPHRKVAGFASLSLIAAFWEYGHHNKFTKRYESAPLISWTAFIYYKKMSSYFTNIMHRTNDN